MTGFSNLRKVIWGNHKVGGALFGCHGGILVSESAGYGKFWKTVCLEATSGTFLAQVISLEATVHFARWVSLKVHT